MRHRGPEVVGEVRYARHERDVFFAGGSTFTRENSGLGPRNSRQSDRPFHGARAAGRHHRQRDAPDRLCQRAFHQPDRGQRFRRSGGQAPGRSLGLLARLGDQGGCGTSQSCRYCGAAKAIVKGLEGHDATQECSIIRASENSLNALNLQVWTAPFSVGNGNLVLSSILDIAHEKSLRSFERIFFHDIMNAVTGIKGLHDIIALELGARYGSELELLQCAIENIRDIIESHKDFLAVETQEYIREDSSFETLPLLSLQASFCQAFTSGGCKQLAVDATSINLSVCSDVRLVQRILVNMIKNALEASRAGDVVHLGCLAAPDGGVTFWVRNPSVMSQETRLRVFEKGFSTKGRGRGFGTYGMRLFAETCLGGHIRFTSEPGQGTVFYLDLPAGPGACR